MSDPSTQRYAVASIEGSEPDGRTTRVGARARGQRTSFKLLQIESGNTIEVAICSSVAYSVLGCRIPGREWIRAK